MQTNNGSNAQAMRDALASLPGYSCSQVTETPEGFTFSVEIPDRTGGTRRNPTRLPGHTQRRTITHDGTLIVTHL